MTRVQEDQPATCDLNICHAAAKFISILLTQEQKDHRLEVCQELRQCAVDDPTFTLRVITGNDAWVYGYDPKATTAFTVEELNSSTEKGEAGLQLDQVSTFSTSVGIVHRPPGARPSIAHSTDRFKTSETYGKTQSSETELLKPFETTLYLNRNSGIRRSTL